MGNKQSTPHVNYEDVQLGIKSSSYIIINTLPVHEQNCLIAKTIPANKEEIVLNEKIRSSQFSEKIIIYGKNCNDFSILEKYNQCLSLGLETYVYKGGLFEWLLLQDIYGEENFPTIGKENDILKFKPNSKFNNLYLTHSIN